MKISQFEFLSQRVTLMSLALLLVGCATAPEIQRPTLSVPDAFQTRSTNPAQLIPAGKPWWNALGDAMLDKLVDTAFENNRDVSQAIARIEQARARTTDARGAMKPQVGVGALIERRDDGRDISATGNFNPTLHASYEADLFGRLRSAIKSSDASLRASEEDLAALKVSLAADVVGAYLQLRYADLRLVVYGDRYNALRDLLAIDRVRLETGVTDASGLARTQADLDQVISDRAAAERERAEAEARLATLTATPGLRIAAAGSTRLLPIPFADTPAAVLRRRPDIRAAEARLMAANAQAYQAYAARFPGLTLSTSAGFASTQFHTVLERASLSWAVSALLDATLFDGGRREAQQTGAMAQAREVAAATDAAVLRAMEEIETALSAYEVEDRALQAISDAFAQTQRLEKLAETQRAAGAVGRQAVLEAKLASQSAELNRLGHERARQVAVVNAARALAL